ncbi:MAG: GPW/gp25 family protein [Magnetococcus sp. WYHC-3]
MSGLSVKLPLSIDPDDGPYSLNKTYVDLVKQNLKNLILTNPGERMMDINFGVGLRNYLFENNGEDTYTDIKEKISEQVGKYMPFLELDEILVYAPEDDVRTAGNIVYIKVGYKIVPLNIQDILVVTQDIQNIP